MRFFMVNAFASIFFALLCISVDVNAFTAIPNGILAVVYGLTMKESNNAN